jgi:hypothetical protein
VLLQIERPETLELMRRNIEQLKTELAEAGWENVDFSFGQESAPDQQAQSEAESAPWVALEQEISAASEEPSSKDQHIATRGSGLSGLDLRF